MHKPLGIQGRKITRRKKPGGMMFWQLIDDLTVNGLVDKIHQTLKN
jgi:hypothetical protein